MSPGPLKASDTMPEKQQSVTWIRVQAVGLYISQQDCAKLFASAILEEQLELFCSHTKSANDREGALPLYTYKMADSKIQYVTHPRAL